jgi:hypothetical protein
VPESYHRRRAARDPAWHAAQVAGATERARARRDADPDGYRAERRAAMRRMRERERASGRTFHEPVKSTGAEPASSSSSSGTR